MSRNRLKFLKSFLQNWIETKLRDSSKDCLCSTKFWNKPTNFSKSPKIFGKKYKNSFWKSSKTSDQDQIFLKNFKNFVKLKKCWPSFHQNVLQIICSPSSKLWITKTSRNRQEHSTKSCLQKPNFCHWWTQRKIKWKCKQKAEYCVRTSICERNEKVSLSDERSQRRKINKSNSHELCKRVKKKEISPCKSIFWS